MILYCKVYLSSGFWITKAFKKVFHISEIKFRDISPKEILLNRYFMYQQLKIQLHIDCFMLRLFFFCGDINVGGISVLTPYSL